MVLTVSRGELEERENHAQWLWFDDDRLVWEATGSDAEGAPLAPAEAFMPLLEGDGVEELVIEVISCWASNSTARIMWCDERIDVLVVVGAAGGVAFGRLVGGAMRTVLDRDIRIFTAAPGMWLVYIGAREPVVALSWEAAARIAIRFR